MRKGRARTVYGKARQKYSMEQKEQLNMKRKSRKGEETTGKSQRLQEEAKSPGND